ncbi:MAG: glycosyltransferase [Clostridium sp.]|nr:glycosyltransferase [Clostridium sp.]
MRALILSVSVGGGHMHASAALKNYILKFQPNSEIKILDTIKYINPLLDKLIIGSYLKSIQINPSIFGKLYKYTERDDGITSVTNKFIEIISNKILPVINDYKPDIIICTHPFPTEMASILKGKGKIDVPILCILTDYSPHNSWLHPNVDAYIVSNSDMKSEMINRGIDKNSIFDFGIPVDSNFFKKYDRSEILSSIGLEADKKTIMIMGGSLGIGKIAYVYSQISKSTSNIQVIVISGNNKKLYSKLMEIKKSSNTPTCILGFTDNVDKYMQCSDLLITKPGGLTITEALICKIPIATISPIPGPEKKNEEFLLKHNLAITLGNGKNCIELVEKLLSSPEKIQEMKQNCNKFSKPGCDKDIFNLIQSLLCKREIAIMKDDRD